MIIYLNDSAEKYSSNPKATSLTKRGTKRRCENGKRMKMMANYGMDEKGY